MIQVKALNEEGVERFRAWLSSPAGPAPSEILTNDALCRDAPGEWYVDNSLRFGTTYEIGVYLVNSVFGPSADRFAIRADRGMWAWLSLALLPNLLKRGRGKDGKPFDVPHYIETDARRAYRLIVRTAWELVHLHGTKARVALSSPRTAWGDVAEQITARQEIYAHPGFWEVAESMYLKSDGTPKAGVATIRKKEHRKDPKSRVGLGAARRLISSFGQFERTYLLREMNAEEILAILPAEYAGWSAPSGA
ncbi:TPA: hypothetical protein ACG4OH_000647 [Stenotrophomonas maltophilia]|uniref:hypothetical protein n=1 Tax=Stenotrophomonas maltophilia TaxID=40324 RepID=UPI0011B8D1B9|nr:hypothetical protein [Stenotrophomonas maltophilia]EKT4448106.1 hypothetical protein [Stenotrophomonas maltophilia]UKJ26121.1 hypothetical protein L6173_02000 [Stenotrophomonas maltophilia]GFF07834.1 hypothetical protein SM139_2926 [Stenotrophomonas maltophilia]HDS1638067.1 hypothetical protein [Stenotrophomonas maltophilia]